MTLPMILTSKSICQQAQLVKSVLGCLKPRHLTLSLFISFSPTCLLWISIIYYIYLLWINIMCKKYSQMPLSPNLSFAHHTDLGFHIQNNNNNKKNKNEPAGEERADIAGVQGAGVGLVWDPPACGSDWWKESHRSSPSAALLLSWLRQSCSHTALRNMCLRVFSRTICHLISPILSRYFWTFPNVGTRTWILNQVGFFLEDTLSV